MIVHVITLYKIMCSMYYVYSTDYAIRHWAHTVHLIVYSDVLFAQLYSTLADNSNSSDCLSEALL